MSQLQKAIARIQRRESGSRIGFGATAREKPKALLLGVVVSDGASAKAALEAGADVVILQAGAAASAAAQLKQVNQGSCAGALLPSLAESDVETLRTAGCDFVVASLEGAAATAVDTEKMGHVVAVKHDISDTTLRALAPLGLDGLYVDHERGAMSLGEQLELVRLSSFANSPLLVAIGANPSVAELRVLRDSGVAVAVAPEGTKAGQLTALAEALKAVPPPKKARREGGEMALVPAFKVAAVEEEEIEEPEG